MADREKVIKGLETCSDVYYGADGACSSCPYSQINGDRCLAELVHDAIGLLKEQEWHMLTEDDDGFIYGLPGDDGQYLMTDGKDIWIDDYMDGVDDGIFLDSGRDIREITAWMYMPELPKKDRR